ncbi:MAG TPA: rhodanese-like domain-containing protein, partial [Alphaproteobacteria bacterium]|nr:rhodanese-like domain-containing protein [Alphaproteobacteria bacterium]
LLAPRMVPRRSARVVLLDDASGLAERAAAVLEGLGYSDVHVLEGGIEAWRDAGYVLFSGVHVPSKAFGELVEHDCGTPHIEATALKALMDEGSPLVVLDSRPLDEFRVMSIPGGIDCPGAELAYRVHDLAPNPDTLVVVNCAGRTRSIIGAQSLINAGIPNRVVALKNGTMGWHLSGLALERGQERSAGTPSAQGLQKARACARDVAARHGVPLIDRETLARWQAEAESRTLYLLDVRSPEEYAAGHPRGVPSAPGGQLVQETETWCATLGARIVLVDDTGVRATMTAHWLRQMGWDAAVLEGGLDGFALETGPWRDPPPGIAGAAANALDPAALQSLLEAEEAVVLDLGNSRGFAAGHVPGAWWAVRARLAQSLPRLPRAARLVLTSEDGIVARLAAPEASELTGAEVQVLEGGTAAWREAGLPLEEGLERLADERDDVWLKPYDHGQDVEARMRQYLTWEVDLLGEVARDGDHRFALTPQAAR